MKSSTTLSIIAALIIIGGAVFLTKNSPQSQDSTPVNNVSIIDGKQIIEINARGGYQPNKSIAKAGIPTILRFKTNGAFDCSSSIRIPSLGINRTLLQTGSTDIDLGIPKTTPLQGTCGMGMYSFEVDFQN